MIKKGVVTLDFKCLLKNVKLKRYISLVFVCGIMLIVFSDKFYKPVNSQDIPKERETNIKNEEHDDLEKRLEALFEQIEGAGKVKVMITYKSGPEKVVATETKSAEDTLEETASNTNRTSRSVSSEVKMAYSEGDTYKGEPFIIKENTPEIEGVVVVAQGGGDIMVKEAISKAAQALFNVPAHKVEVLRKGV